jgi:hypothetical protein
MAESQRAWEGCGALFQREKSKQVEVGSARGRRERLETKELSRRCCMGRKRESPVQWEGCNSGEPKEVLR